jgi:hypothetical protein
MEELKSTKVDWKKIAVVGMLVLLSGLVTGGATWYVSDMGKQAELDVKDEEIATIETRVEQLEALNRVDTTDIGTVVLSDNTFDINTVKTGDKVGALTVSKVNKISEGERGAPGNVQFKGTITVTGTYEITNDSTPNIGDNVCLKNLDAASLNKLPIEKNDQRNVWFCFTNKEKAKNLLGPATSGTVTVNVSDYYVELMEAAVWNTALLVSKQ